MMFLDTNIIVHALNQRKPAIRARLRAEQARGTTMIISPIVRFELEYGIAKSKRAVESRAILDAFLAGFETLPFDSGDAREAGEIRGHLDLLGMPIGPYDLLIAAQARRRGARLVTSNRREFDRVPNLIVVDWDEAPSTTDAG